MTASKISPGVCPECLGPMPPAQPRGRPRQVCSDRCRQRRRRSRNAMPWPPTAPASYPQDPETLRRRTAEALTLVLSEGIAAPPEDQLQQGLLELDWLGYRLRMLERDLPRRLAARAGELGRQVQLHRRRLFPTVEEATP